MSFLVALMNILVAGTTRNFLISNLAVVSETFILKRVNSFRLLSLSGNSFAERKMSRLSEEQRRDLLNPLISNGWTLEKDRDAIHKSFEFKDFNQAFGFMLFLLVAFFTLVLFLLSLKVTHRT